MKTLVKLFGIILIINMILLLWGFGSKTYCDGWNKGYVRGYCGTDIYCIKPVVPVCPVHVVNFNTYQDGYDRGLKAGNKKRKKE